MTFRTPLWQKIIQMFLLMLVSLVVVIPFIWMITLSLRTTMEIYSNPVGFPSSLYLKNYVRLFSPDIKFYRYFGNSILVTGMGILFTLSLASFGGYGFGRQRYNFRFRGTLFLVLLFALMLPRQAMYIPQYLLMSRYKLLNSHIGLALVYTAYSISIATFLLKTYFSQMPEELEESARLDGAGDMRIFASIMLPLTKPVLLTVVLLSFMQMWNELMLAMTMITNHAKRTLPLAMMNFVGENGADYAMVASSLVIGMLPLIILYLTISEKFVAGLTAGAIKG